MEEKKASKYKFTKEMGEISGFGGGYEEDCQKMVIAGLEWLDINNNIDLSYKQSENIFGLVFDESEDVKKLQQIMCDAVDEGCTGAMMHGSLNHIRFIVKNGWKKYKEEKGS